MTRDEYLGQFERWVGGSKQRKARTRAELEEHLSGAEEAGEFESAMKRLGDPRSAARDFTSGYELRPSPLPRRFLAALIDMLIFFTLIAVGMGFGTWESRPSGAFFSGDLSVNLGVFGQPVGRSWYLASISWFGVCLVLLGVLWWFVILPLLEWRTGRTAGKAALGLRVIAEDGTAPSFGQVVVRRLTLIFSGPLQLFDWAFVFFNARRQRAFDSLAKTVVVTERESWTRKEGS
jgi:uncharacterized RDD family membrane protein YckC